LGNDIHRHVLTVTGLSPSPAPPSKGLHLHTHFLTARQAGRPNTAAPTTPQMQPLPGITHLRFSLIRFRSPLLSESQLFSLPMGTEMFHFPTFPPHALYIQAQVTRHDSCWVPPFGHPRITARLPTPQGLSQAPTSFIGSRCQGIHHVPFTACHHQHHTTPNTNPTRDKTRPSQHDRSTTSAADTPQKKQNTQNNPPHPQGQGQNPNPQCKEPSCAQKIHHQPTDSHRQAAVKMLASTIHISNNNPTPPRTSQILTRTTQRLTGCGREPEPHALMPSP
jgi:hypothetical protein